MEPGELLAAASSGHPRFLAEDERRTADALFDSLVPTAGGRGGARATRAVDYLDFMLGL